LKRVGLTLQLQMTYLLLFGTSMVAALWMKGQPVLTFVLLGALFPLGLLARLPEKYFSEMFRQIFQILIAAGGVYWGKTRMADASLDLALVETTALLGMALVVGGVRKEYEMLVTLSVILLGFGGLSPGRPMYFKAFFGFIGMAVLLLYQTRTLRLFGLEGEVPEHVPLLRQNWGYRLMHLALTVGLTLFLLSTVPMPHGRVHTRGFFPVSFDTKQQLEFPELWHNWVKPAKSLWSDDPGITQTIDSDFNPTVMAKNSPRLVKAQGQESFDARDGLGGFGLGKDLVFRVRVPAKLYWLGQVYDTYDGKTWSASRMLREGKSGLDKFRPRNEQEIVQVFRVEKNVTRHLVGAYRPTKYEYLDPRQRKDVPLPGSQITLDNFLGGTTFRDDKTPLVPWTYRVTSMTPVLGSDNPMAPWESNLRRGWNYRYVPRKLVTPRLRRLATQITAGIEGDMSKATALRDFLRKNYTYNLSAPRIPKDREVVDYFLFETREGYCQHFAQALTVLARLSGLPARVATGFLPGDYNVLSNCFEVYEYHAHAWCQIFIEPWGWLTFDGAPPGELPMRKGTSLIGNLMDPFGEDWSAYPPEFSKPVEDTRKQSNEKQTVKKQDDDDDGGSKPSFFSKAASEVYEKAVMDSGGMEPTPQELVKAALMKGLEWAGALLKAVREGIVNWGARAWDRIKSGTTRLVDFLRGLPVIVDVVLALFLVFLHMLWRRRRRIRRWFRTWLFRRAARRMWESVEQSRHAAPATVIGLCHELSWRLLRLVGQRRPGNLDAIEFSDWLAERDPELGREMAVLAPSIARRLFSNRLPDREEADDVYGATARLRQLVFDRLSDPTRTTQPAQI
jgi:transglutaminase-like putative cysteine protease